MNILSNKESGCLFKIVPDFFSRWSGIGFLLPTQIETSVQWDWIGRILIVGRSKMIHKSNKNFG